MLVTGASGFIGGRLLKIAAEAGWNVVAMVRRQGLSAESAALVREVRMADLRDDPSLRSAVAGITCVVHLAGLTRAKTEAEFHDFNAAGTRRLVDAITCTTSGVVPRLIHVSSLSAGGPSAGRTPVDEGLEPAPVSPYGRSKLAGENEVKRAAAALRWTIIRPPIVYGPGERDVLDLFRRSRSGLVPVVGFQERWYSIVHVDDLCRAILAAAASDRAVGRTYYIANQTPLSGAELAERIIRATGGRARPIRIPDWVAGLVALAGSAAKPFRRTSPLVTLDKYPEIVRSWVCSPARASAELGFEPQIPIDDGLRTTADWYRAAGWL